MPKANFTDALLRTLKPRAGARVSEYRDGEVSGLEIRIWESGSKSWRFHYTRRSDGRRRVVGLGSYPNTSLKEARRKARRLQTEVEDLDTRADPAGDRHARLRAQTFSDIADDWLERHARPNKSARAVRDDISMLDRHVRPKIGRMRVTEIAKRDVIRLLDEVAAKPDGRKGRKSAGKMTHRPNRVFELVRAIFRWAASRDLLTVDPTFGLAPPIRKERPRERDLSPDEIKRLWEALDKTPVERRHTTGLPIGSRAIGDDDIPMTRATALALKLALVTGQRIGEVTGIALSELALNDTAPLWTVPGERSKNGQSNRVPLSPLAVWLIQEALKFARGGAWLFPSPKGEGPIDAHAPTKGLERARGAIGIRDFRIHDLRRTAATQMAEIGISPHTIAQILNHVSARQGTITSKVYVQYSYEREKRDALCAWAARLEAILAGKCSDNVHDFVPRRSTLS